ncbi:ATPase subunit of ABC transporter with duplicated ATPase domains [Arcanobacterium wilhelmae]|uniref:ATPase subunit of ABC transporter with duplicated ATPase domains n=1 Tax=Arcanobacterium wilhelmae TaxID=1803177 RepID=A0ABT9NCI6_9ACTO|nr:ABC-F family ATP-binding cassette domain-containing protein [Arcanobacterium wilhelmae]MDP9801210.1 ATPase subunit of ABC transporter with duplicated ATPase domains [Arcanobacterium wilhelmae]WFN90560.1 ABC-F family ATP-binding cassette domain-containing protein [Arcanobacterium wilhelmae]
MAHILGFEGVSVSLGSRPILGDLNVSFGDGARIGIVGPNGGGKSTLLKLMTHALEPDVGQVTMVSGTRFAVLTQADSLDPLAEVAQAIHGDSERFEWASDAAMRALHDGLIPDIPLDKRVGELSGGQRRRVALAATLAAPSDVVVLDEPTNHLDIEGITYLARYLNERFGRGEGALVVVTHDRWFLDAVCDRLWEVVPGNDGAGGRDPQPGHVEEYEGGYAAYVLQRAERARLAQAAAEKRANLLRKELAWLRRGAPARTSKPRFRIEAANELIANEPPPRDTIELAKMTTSRLGKQVVDLEDVWFSYDAGAREAIEAGEQPAQVSAEFTLQDVTLRLAPGERIGILGGNGAGKSSLLGLLNGTFEPTAGRIKRGKTVVLATLSQETRELDEIGERRVVEAVHDIASHVMVGKKELTAAQLVEMMGFTRERAWTKVSELSGGERRRLQLMRLMIGEPNVLLLDEPTNDLDTDTLAAVEDLLDSWPGTLVVVSHDRYFLERTTDHQVAVMHHRVRDLPGGVDQYLELREAEIADAGAQGAGSASGSTGSGEVSEPTAKKTSDPAKERAAKKTMARLERQMGKLTEKIEKLGVTLGDVSASVAETGAYDQLAELGREIAELKDEHEALELEWLEAAEEVERWG